MYEVQDPKDVIRKAIELLSIVPSQQSLSHIDQAGLAPSTTPTNTSSAAVSSIPVCASPTAALLAPRADRDHSVPSQCGQAETMPASLVTIPPLETLNEPVSVALGADGDHVTGLSLAEQPERPASLMTVLPLETMTVPSDDDLIQATLIAGAASMGGTLAQLLRCSRAKLEACLVPDTQEPNTQAVLLDPVCPDSLVCSLPMFLLLAMTTIRTRDYVDVEN